MASATTPKKVLVPVANGSEEMEAVIVIDVLVRAGCEVTVASVEDTAEITASRGVKLVAGCLIGECEGNQYDLIALPGGMPGAERLRDSVALEAMVKSQSGAGRMVAAICATPAVALGPWGLLDGKKATSHPAFVDRLPDASESESRVVVDGNIVTSRGPGTSFEFALDLINLLHMLEPNGERKVAEVAGPMVLPAAEQIKKVVVAQPPPPEHAAPKVLVPVANGSEEMEAVIVIDVLVRAGCEVTVASVEDTAEITASRGVKLVAGCLIGECEGNQYDLIALPGGMPGAERLRDSVALEAMVKSQSGAGRMVAAICATPAVALGPWGLLDGKKTTSHPAFVDRLPDASESESRVVVDGNIVTSRGPGTSFEFALELVRCLLGEDESLKVAGPMVLPPQEL